MSFDFDCFFLPVLGFAIGLLVSMLGGGGGIFYVPALTLLFDLPTQLAVSTSLASIIPTTAIASLSHKRSGNLDLSIGLIFGVAGITGALIGAYISSMLPSALLGIAKIRAETLERIYSPLFVSTVVVLGIVMILR
jgi:hypothetical protein